MKKELFKKRLYKPDLSPRLPIINNEDLTVGNPVKKTRKSSRNKKYVLLHIMYLSIVIVNIAH